MFRIYPAVDIKGGKCVRLYQGDLRRETVFSERPWEMARRWEALGASFLHVVDLDGASSASLINIESVKDIMDRVGIPVQVGGGVRSREDIDTLLSIGVDRVVLGTQALLEPDFILEMTGLFGRRIIVSLDTRGGELAVSGWRMSVKRTVDEVLEHLLRCGVKRVIHTDISRDGTLGGYDTGVIEPLLDRGLGIIAAGGISSAKDLLKLKGLVPEGVEGAIVGRALYTGDLDLEEVLPYEEV